MNLCTVKSGKTGHVYATEYLTIAQTGLYRPVPGTSQAHVSNANNFLDAHADS
jgi:hypothetical protein